jgi:hypothetical protein
MEQVVQQNATLVEEATAATESMKAQSIALMRGVSRFNIGAGETVQAAAPAPSVPVAGRPELREPIRFIRSAPARKPQAQEDAPSAPARGQAGVNGDWKEF